MKNTKINETYSYTNKKFDYTFEFPFRSKKSYLQWLKEWNEEYSKLSSDIRETKLEIKKLQKAKEASGNLQCGLYGYPGCKTSLKHQAQRLLAMRAAARIESQRHWLMEKSQQLVVTNS